MTDPVLLEMRGVSKSFSGVTVLKDVNLKLQAGEVIGLLGENGAGKSTLIKILCGIHQLDGGEILLDGSPVVMSGAAKAQQVGIRTVYQELSLFPHLKVYENVCLRAEPTYGPGSLVSPLRTGQMRRESRTLLRDVLGVTVDVDERVADLPLGEQQLVEIAKAVRANARIIVLDEPTTTLERREKDRLFRVINDLKQRGTAIIFISHHLDEVAELCDRTVVLRDGIVVTDASTSTLDAPTMITAMSGKSPADLYPKEQVEIGEPMLEVSGLSRERLFHDVSFDVRSGEILGIVGLVGCGKGELVRGVFGALPVDRGSITVRGRGVQIKNVRQARRLGLSYLPADRKGDGIFPERSVEWNMTIGALQRFRGRFGINQKRESEVVRDRVREFRVKLASPKQAILRLSGGNQQKVLLARVLMGEPDVLLLEEPTRGIDVNAKTEMYRLITSFVKQGKAVVLVSSEETEVSAMCDRVLVMREGRVAARLDAAEADPETIKLYSMSSDRLEEGRS